MSITLAFSLPYIGFTGILMAALPVYALVKFLRRHPSRSIELAYTDAEKESFLKAVEATFGKAVPFPHLFHEMTSLDFLVIPPNESCPFFILCTMGPGAYRMHVPEKWLEKEAKKISVMQSLRFPGHDRAELMMHPPPHG